MPKPLFVYGIFPCRNRKPQVKRRKTPNCALQSKATVICMLSSFYCNLTFRLSWQEQCLTLFRPTCHAAPTNPIRNKRANRKLFEPELQTLWVFVMFLAPCDLEQNMLNTSKSKLAAAETQFFSETRAFFEFFHAIYFLQNAYLDLFFDIFGKVCALKKLTFFHGLPQPARYFKGGYITCSVACLLLSVSGCDFWLHWHHVSHGSVWVDASRCDGW